MEHVSRHCDNFEDKMKTYNAMIWEDNPEKPGRRLTLLAESLDDAKRQLEEKFGNGSHQKCEIFIYVT